MSKEEDMQRTLVAEFGPLSWLTDRDGIVSPTVQGGYTNLSATNTALFYEEATIDLSGYAMERKTFYPYSSFEQRNGVVLGSFSDATTIRAVIDTIIVSSIPLSTDQLSMSLLSANLPGFTHPGGVPYRLDREPLIHQNQLTYCHDSTIQTTGGSSVYRIVSNANGSSLEPTAADKLYCYRIVTSNAKDGSALVPSARVLLPGTITSEPKLEYMMRLKRSYELANQV